MIAVARMLRKNLTKEGKHLWYDFLSAYPVKFTRQKILGHYVADFYCAKAKLVIELDGSGHDTLQGQKHDFQRTAFLEKHGIKVLRIPNIDVMQNFDQVCEHIDCYVTRLIGLR